MTIKTAAKIKKWGNSFAIRLPRDVVRKYALEEGNEIAIRGDDKYIMIHKIPAPNKNLRKDAWKQFVIPTEKKKENVSGNLDRILYSISH